MHNAQRTLAIATSIFRHAAPLLAMACGVAAIQADVRGQAVDFSSEIQPLLARKCYACHGPDVQEGSFRFDDRSTLLSEADTGEIPIVPGKSDQSELLRRVRSSEDWERMPPEGKALSEEEIDLLRRWIDAGAEFKRHWAFQPISDPSLPQVANHAWTRGAIDRFVLAKIEQAGLAPVAEADPSTLVRRAVTDVTGLPPTPEQVARWVEGWDATSYERLVDELLADPALGDRWARNWLDVVRYAETNSFERDNAKPNAWKYRDYVIRAMNDDKPYDQFIREQLAGDELDQVTADSLTATAYYRLGIWDDEPADPKQAIFDEFDDIVTTTTQGMLGLTLNCARCHDHKIDPLTQRDYYAMVAFVRDVTPYATRSDQTSNNQIDLDPDVARQYDALREERRRLEKQSRQLEQRGIKQMSATDQRATEGPERRRVLREKLRDHLSAEDFAEYQGLKERLKAISKAESQLPPRETVLGLAKLHAKPPATHVLMRGSPHAEGEMVEPAFPGLLGGGLPQLPDLPDDADSPGRRRALADWMASEENWLTSRVIVNRIWLHYFGRGIVRSPNNFGLMGDPPTHPQLIDHLATELMRNDWSLKSIHRQILLSSTYRLSTQANGAAMQLDPDNNLFWRQNLRRLSAEQVRDSVLAVSGQLNQARHGPSVFVDLSEEVLASQSRPGQGWGKSTPAEQTRRSIYIHVKRSLPVPMLQAFDFPETDISCEARFLTTQPGQALTMLNSAWMQSQAAALRDRVEREVGASLEAQAARCLELVLCRPASARDVQELCELVQRLNQQHGVPLLEARRAMCLVALNLNEFFYLD